MLLWPSWECRRRLIPTTSHLIQLAAHGQNNATIASNLGISGETVKNHISSVLYKMDAPDRMYLSALFYAGDTRIPPNAKEDLESEIVAGKVNGRVAPQIVGRRVYFIQEKLTGAIKIGTALDVGRRLKNLQGANPNQLVLLGSMAGDQEDEAVLQRGFAKDRIRGEWFKSTPRLLRQIETYN